jgi:hypothetical protein
MPTNKNSRVDEIDLLTKRPNNTEENINIRFFAVEKLAYMQMAKEFNIDKRKAKALYLEITSYL